MRMTNRSWLGTYQKGYRLPTHRLHRVQCTVANENGNVSELHISKASPKPSIKDKLLMVAVSSINIPKTPLQTAFWRPSGTITWYLTIAAGSWGRWKLRIDHMWFNNEKSHNLPTLKVLTFGFSVAVPQPSWSFTRKFPWFLHQCRDVHWIEICRQLPMPEKSRETLA